MSESIVMHGETPFDGPREVLATFPRGGERKKEIEISLVTPRSWWPRIEVSAYRLTATGRVPMKIDCVQIDSRMVDALASAMRRLGEASERFQTPPRAQGDPRPPAPNGNAAPRANGDQQR